MPLSVAVVLVTDVAVGVARVGTTTTTPPSGAKAMPRKAVLAEAVPRLVTAPESVPLYPLESVSVDKVLADVA